MKSNALVPKIITDKNGVTTTRWVRPESQTGPSTDLIPHASVAPKVSSEERRKMVKNLTYQIGNGCRPEMVNVEGALTAIPKFENATLSALTSYFGDAPGDLLDKAAIWIDLYSGQEPLFREILTYHNAFDPITEDSFVEESIYYLRNCGDLPPMEDYSQATGQLQQTIRNLLSATETMIGEDYENQREGNDPILPADMRKLIIDRPDDFERISDILVENPDIYSADRIVLMLKNDAPSLSKGVL